MIAGWWNKNRTPIGLDIGSSQMRLIQLERHGAGWSVAAAASCTLPADLPEKGEARSSALCALAKPLIAANPFRGKRVVSSLPASSIICKNLRVPRMPRDELNAAVEWEASDRLHLSLDTLQLQFLDAGEVRQGEDLRHEIILLAVPTAAVTEHVAMLQACDLLPVAIDATPGALGRCLTQGVTEVADGPARVLLDVGHSSSKIVMVRDGRIVFFKIIDIGGKHFDQIVSQQLNLSLADAMDLRRNSSNEPMDSREAQDNDALFGSTKRESVSRAVYESLRTAAGELAKEVGLCLRYYSVTFRGRRPEELVLVGGESSDPHLARILADGTGIEVRGCPVLSKIDCSKYPDLTDNGKDLGAWAVAAGLAMRTDGLLSMRGAA